MRQECFETLSYQVLKLQTFEGGEEEKEVQVEPCVCECTVYVPVCLSSPHEKFQPSKLTGVEVTDI